MKTMTIDDWEKKYTSDESIESEAFSGEEGYEGMLETYGSDLETVNKITSETLKRVWTMMDGEEGMMLVAGKHLVNRIYYVISNEEYGNEDEEYLVEEY